jgi:hypothetical protein
MDYGNYMPENNVPESEEEDLVEELIPPTPERVAARALTLAAISYRSFMEREAEESGCGSDWGNMLPWLEAVGIFGELEPEERAILETPVGGLSERERIDTSWRSEGMVVLAWALCRSDLPPYRVECEPEEVSAALGLLEEYETSVLAAPQLRPLDEIDEAANVNLALHWRLRQHEYHPGKMDFVAFARDCQWADLSLEGLDVVDNELAFGKTPLDEVDEEEYRHVLSITVERHRAFNWLLGFHTLYSEITTDT